MMLLGGGRTAAGHHISPISCAAGTWMVVCLLGLGVLGASGQQAEPVVSFLSPGNGPTAGGTIITIGGNNFGTAQSDVQPRITVGGVPCPQVVWVSSTTVLCEAPDGVGAGRPIVVEVGSMTSVPNGQVEFTYDGPKVQAIEPAHGPAKGGTMVTIIGSNFGVTNSNPSVTIGGRPCQSVVWLSDTKLQCVAPPGTGVGDVRVFVLDQSSPENFGTVFEFDAPLVNKLVPDHGACAGGYTITLEGVNFGTTQSIPKISLGGVKCTSTAWVSDKEVTCVVPRGQGSDKQAIVEILGQSSKPNTHSFFSYDGPQIDRLSPPNGPTIGGTQVTIYGLNFGDSNSGKDMSVKVGNIPCSSAAWESESSITCIVPPGIGPRNQVQVVINGLPTEECEDDNMPCTSAYRYDAPVIAAVRPNHGPTTGGYVVDVPGDNFGTSPTSLTLSVGNKACESSRWVSNTMATCLVPAGVGITQVVAQVEGQKSDGAAFDADVFSYDAPQVRAIWPSTGNPEGGQLVTVEGINFGAEKDLASLLIGDTPARIVHVSNERILAVLPAGEGQDEVEVSIAGQPAVHANGEVVPIMAYSGPQISRIVPDHGATQGGQEVRIYGRDLGTKGSKMEIDVGGIECIDSSWVSETEVTCTTPPGAGGNKRVRVVIDGKYTATSPPSAAFSYSAPRIDSVTPGSGSTLGGTKILLQGKNFGLTDSNPVAYVGPTKCEATTWTDDAAVTCVTPAWSQGPVVVPVSVRVFGQDSGQTANAVYQFGSARAPTITSLAWTRAPTEGGFTITVYGSKFESQGVDASVGTPSGTDESCVRTVWVSESKILCKAPAGVGGHLPVTIKSKDFPQASTFGRIAFDYDPPEVTAVSRSSGAIGGGMSITIEGFGFGLEKTNVEGLIGDTACTSSAWVSDTSMTCTTPAGQGTSDPVRAKVGGQLSTLRKGGPIFKHEGLAITAVSPSHAPTSGGADITMYAMDFGDGARGGTQAAPRAFVGGGEGRGTACLDTEWLSMTAIRCRVPAGVGAALSVTVDTKSGGQAVGGKYEGYGLFSYAQPVVTSVFPSQGNSAGGLPMTIVGMSFGQWDSEPVAYVGNTQCERTLFVSDTNLVCVTPVGGGNHLAVRAVIGGQSSAPLAAFDFTPPRVLYVEPTEGPVAGGASLTIHGRDFGISSAAVSRGFVGPLACANTTWVSNRQVVCVTPRGDDLFVRHDVYVQTEGVLSEASSTAQYSFVEKRGLDASGLDIVPPGSQDRASSGRAPGVYLTIAYLVALIFIVASVFCIRVLFSQKSGGQLGGSRGGAKARRGLVARVINKMSSLFWRNTADYGADGALYHAVDAIDIEMEASSELNIERA